MSNGRCGTVQGKSAIGIRNPCGKWIGPVQVTRTIKVPVNLAFILDNTM
jgi:hypothetical protein